MKAKWIAFALFFTVTQSGWALLAPLAQSSVEIKKILDSQEFSNSIGAGEVIQAINREEGGYEVITTNHKVLVKVIPIESHRIGPQQFRLEFGTFEKK